MKLIKDIYLRSSYSKYASSCSSINKVDFDYYYKIKLFSVLKNRTHRTFYKIFPSNEIISNVLLYNCNDYYIVRNINNVY